MAKRARLFWIGVVTTLAVSCSVGGTAPTQPEAPEVTRTADVDPTLTLAPTASSTPRPSPTIAPTPLPSLEIVASRAWTDFDEDVVVDVLLRNSTETPVYLSGIFAVLLDSAGEHVIGEQGYVFDGLVMGGLGRMFPGELVPASIRINMDPEAPLEWDHYEVRLLDAQEYPISPDEYTADFETSVTTVANYGSGIVGLSGAVVNNGSQAVEMVFLRAVLYDEEDDFLGAAEGMVWSLAAGASAPFSLDGIVDPGSEIGRYEVTAVARLGTP